MTMTREPTGGIGFGPVQISGKMREMQLLVSTMLWLGLWIFQDSQMAFIS
jgi:hypothetical protein